MTDTGITVAGRVFRPTTPRRLEHFQFVSFKMMRAGIMGGGDVLELCAKLAEHGYGPDVFVGLYVECDGDGPLPWTVERARELAQSLKKNVLPPLRKGEEPKPLDLGDMAEITNALTWGVLRFFGPAAASSSDTPTSSSEAETTPTSEASGQPAPSGAPS